MPPETARIVTWRPDLRADFERLNREWIERWFTVEEEDRNVFEDPAGRIVGPGGQIFFVVDEAGVRGTCAVVRHDEETFELAKMAVEPSAQGRGYGDRLVHAAVGFARAAGARRLMLVSNTRLGPAPARKPNHRFRDDPRAPPNRYPPAANQRELLLQTEKALDRLSKGTYGKCESCGNPIGKGRLMAFPRATLCLDCKQREERR